MHAPYLHSLGEISYDQYDEGWDDCLEPADMAPDENYIFRRITTLADPEHFADDFLVHVSSMRRHRSGIIAPAYYDVVMHPVDLDGNISEEVDKKYVDTAGSAHYLPPWRVTWLTPYEDGYFTSAIDEWDIAMCGLLTAPRDRGLTPVGV